MCHNCTWLRRQAINLYLRYEFVKFEVVWTFIGMLWWCPLEQECWERSEDHLLHRLDTTDLYPFTRQKSVSTATHASHLRIETIRRVTSKLYAVWKSIRGANRIISSRRKAIWTQLKILEEMQLLIRTSLQYSLISAWEETKRPNESRTYEPWTRTFSQQNLRTYFACILAQSTTSANSTIWHQESTSLYSPNEVYIDRSHN